MSFTEHQRRCLRPTRSPSGKPQAALQIQSSAFEARIVGTMLVTLAAAARNLRGAAVGRLAGRGRIVTLCEFFRVPAILPGRTRTAEPLRVWILAWHRYLSC